MSEPSILIVVPACNEEETIVDSLRSIRDSIEECRLEDALVRIVVVCDSCTDDTEALARFALLDVPGMVLRVDYRNVGMSREHGVRLGLELHPLADWIVFTDADTLVDRDWLSAHLDAYRQGYDAYCGQVEFEDQLPYLKAFALLYAEQTHPRIHGANLGVRTEAYRAAGGMPKLACHEDKVLVETLLDLGFQLRWDETPTVRTSVRLEGRAPEGFAATLKSFAQSQVLAL